MAAIDETEDGEYLAFVVGSPSKISSNAGLLPPNFKHMTSMNGGKDEKVALLHSFDFEGNIRVFCIKFGLPELKNTVERALSTGKCRKPRNIVNSKIGYEFVYKMKFLFADFAIRNGTTVNDLVFEVDNAMVRRYLNDGGLRSKAPGLAHKIADCIAYANGHHWPVHKNVKEYGTDYKEDFHSKVMKALTRGK